MNPLSPDPDSTISFLGRINKRLFAARAALVARAKRSRIARKLWENRRRPHLIPFLAARKIFRRIVGVYGYGRPNIFVPSLARELNVFLASASDPIDASTLALTRQHLRNVLASCSSLKGISQDLPEVSIVIPVFNQLRYTIRCVESVLASEPKASFEILIINDCSTDQTASFFDDLSPLRLVNQNSNGGFIKACNRGAEESQGSYILFLNNDTHVLPGWLDELVDTLKSNDRIAIVGSQLLYPDGTQQEAGGILWGDETACNYGRNDDPSCPEYNYLRSVDYCSGASILIGKKHFNEFGCFDLAYAPAYCEDVELALQARARGFDVVYQPRSKVIHFEGKSCGRDTSSGVKAYQVVNLKRLFKRWRSTVSLHRTSGSQPELERDRGAVGHILFVDACVPTPDRDAGSIVADSWIRILQSLGYHITFVGVHQFTDVAPYTDRLERMGVYCPRFPYDRSPRDFIVRHARNFDGVVTCRHECSRLALDAIIEAGVTIPTIFLPIDLHYVREARLAEIENSAWRRSSSEQTKELELEIVARSNITCVHSSFERDELHRQIPSGKVVVSPIMFPVPGRSSDFESRRDICFIGGFKHTPNIDAMVYFVNEVWPLVIEKLPDIKFRIIGGDAPPEVAALASSSVEVLGFVPDLEPTFKTIRLSVAPLRYGAGVKGKVGISMSNGIPVIGTPMAFEGMNLREGDEVLSASTPTELAGLIVRAYTDRTLWYRISDGSVRRACTEYSLEGNAPLIAELLASAGITAHGLSQNGVKAATR